MSNQTSAVRRRAGWSGILVFLTMAIALGLIIGGGISEQQLEEGAVDIILTNMASHPTMLVISMWGFLVMNVFVVIFSIDLYRVLENEQSGLLFAPASAIGAAVLFIVETLMTIGIIQGLAPAYGGATGTEQTLIQDTTLALVEFRNHTALLAGILVAVAAIVFGREMLRSTDFPRWMGYLGLAVGVLGVIGAFYPLLSVLSFARMLEQTLFSLGSYWNLGEQQKL